MVPWGMISTLSVQNFTLFDQAQLRFSGGLNVFVGQNGTGKSHLMKLLYANLRALMSEMEGAAAPTKKHLETAIARRLKGIFRPDALGRLTRRQQGRCRADVCMSLEAGHELRYSFSTQSSEAVSVEAFPASWNDKLSVYLPTREMLSIYPNFTGTYESVEIPFEETWYDLARMLGRPLSKGPKRRECSTLLDPLQAPEVLNGTVVLENGRFYLRSKDNGKLEAHLLSEGLRKIATVAHLIANGSLTQGSVLFGDEPEAKLNPLLVRRVAATIQTRVERGTQVFIATHSLFLLRELYLLERASRERVDAGAGYEPRYFTLQPGSTPEQHVQIACASDMNGLPDLASLDAQVDQDERLMEIYRHGI